MLVRSPDSGRGRRRKKGRHEYRGRRTSARDPLRLPAGSRCRHLGADMHGVDEIDDAASGRAIVFGLSIGTLVMFLVTLVIGLGSGLALPTAVIMAGVAWDHVRLLLRRRQLCAARARPLPKAVGRHLLAWWGAVEGMSGAGRWSSLPRVGEQRWPVGSGRRWCCPIEVESRRCS